jgi:hypothetical protein
MLSIRSFILVALPFALLVAAGTLIRRHGNPETVGRRFFLFLVGTGAALWALVLVNGWLSPMGSYNLATMLAPLITGVMALIFLHLRAFAALRRREKGLFLLALVLLLGLAAVTLSYGAGEEGLVQTELRFVMMAILVISGLLAAAWTLGKHSPVALGLLTLICLALFNGLDGASLPIPAEPPPAWLPALAVGVYLVLPGLVVAVTAVLAATTLGLLPAAGQTSPPTRRAMLGRLLLVLLLLGAYIYTFAWMWLWDGTNDGLRGLAVLTVSGVTALGAALVLAMTATGWRRWTGLAFPVLLIGLMSWVVSNAWSDVSNPTHQVTEARAARIQEAVEHFQAKTGHYPADLQALVPGELWRIPQPMLIPDQGWCYEGGPDYYRLGTIYREHWSAPFVEIQVYASAGTVPETRWTCDEKLAELRSELAAVFNTFPTPVPLPTSAVSSPRIAVAPALRAPNIAVGRWSPDGAYLVFGLAEYYGDLGAKMEIDLHFLNAQTGAICRAGDSKWTAERSDGLRDHFAWLPDGRGLYVSDGGQMVVFTPCAEDVEDITNRYPAAFTRALSYDEQSGRVLLRSQAAFWLLDGSSLEVRQIPGIIPGPVESQWGWYAWSAGGERLAISLMSSPDTGDGATLSVVNGATGALEQNMRLEDASDANLPFPAWLTWTELLVHGHTLTVMDMGVNPPAVTSLLRDVFLLDAAYPFDFSSMAYASNPSGNGYYLAVRLDHPRNQGVYLFDSQTGQVTAYEHDLHSLLVLPDGRLLRLPKREDEPTYRDAYVVEWIDRPGEAQRLVVEGHTPREHPQIFPQYLPTLSQLVVSSSQGVSLVTVPDGETVAFWELAGSSGRGSWVYPAPGGEALVVVASGDGLYYIPLP